MTDELTERMAQAAYAAFRGDLALPWERLSDDYQDDWQRVARAVIDAYSRPPECADEFCIGWKDSGTCPRGARHSY